MQLQRERERWIEIVAAPFPSIFADECRQVIHWISIPAVHRFIA
jgi:hypothetical protein